MGKITTVLAMAALFILVVGGEGQAFRCGSGLVNVGDSAGKVLIECGPPTSKEVVGATTKGKTTASSRQGKVKRGSKGQETYRESSRKVERWFYNCGEHDFIYVLTFEGGVLEREQTEGYGRGASDCRGRR
jgi:hypothetical protein